MEWDDFAALAGRSLVALLFLASAFRTITDFPSAVGFLSRSGLPWAPFFCAASAAVESACGVALLLGRKTRWAAAVLGVYLIPETWAFHAEPRADLLKNLAIIGALLQIMAWGPGRLSLDGRSDEI